MNCDPFPIPVPWLDGFFALPGDYSLHRSELYQSARLYGQDVSSGAAVAVLMTNDHDCSSQALLATENETKAVTAGSTTQTLRVLDLCCSPGLKLCAIADTLMRQGRDGVVVGVDVSEQRIALCKRIVLKYQVPAPLPAAKSESESKEIRGACNNPPRIRLYCNDGTRFASIKSEDLQLVFDSHVARQDCEILSGKRKRMNKSSKAREQRMLRDTKSFDLEPIIGKPTKTIGKVEQMKQFDLVLVDAECSTDGSAAHIQQRSTKECQQRSKICLENHQHILPTMESKQWSTKTQLKELEQLQQNLLATGYNLLQSGGTLVYSTCSLDTNQNEGIVAWLLNRFSCAKIVRVEFSCHGSSKSNCNTSLVTEGSIPGTAQFHPNLDKKDNPLDMDRLFGGGFFLAKLTKTLQASDIK